MMTFFCVFVLGGRGEGGNCRYGMNPAEERLNG